jgi:hypothetical protein
MKRAYGRAGAPRSPRARLGTKLLVLGISGLSVWFLMPQQGAAKLSPAPDDDGLTDPEDEAVVDQINDHISELGAGDMTQAEYEQWSADHQALIDQLNPSSQQCLLITPPTPSSSGGYPECVVAEDTSACQPYPCASGQVSACQLSDFPFNDVADDYQVKIEKGLSLARNEEELVQMAWAILQANGDLASWVSCMYYGESERSFLGFDTSVAKCLSDKIDGKNPRAKVVFTTMAEAPSSSAAAWGSKGGGGKISLPTDGVWWQGMVSSYTAAVDDSSEEFCLAAKVAGVLLHELVHTCPSSKDFDNHPAGGDEPSSCTTSYLIESGFLWALGERYPCLSTTSCSDFLSDSLWGSDG